jgi:hypothetical protein
VQSLMNRGDVACAAGFLHPLPGFGLMLEERIVF